MTDTPKPPSTEKAPITAEELRAWIHTASISARASDLIERAADRISALESQLAESERLRGEAEAKLHWEDVNDEWTADINAAYPTRSGSHDAYGVAMQMVGHRHSKGELVALVNWLLVKRGEAEAKVEEAECWASSQVSLRDIFIRDLREELRAAEGRLQLRGEILSAIYGANGLSALETSWEESAPGSGAQPKGSNQ